MTPARALERAVVLPNDANLANDRRRRHRSTSARARETRDGRSGTRARAIADGESAQGIKGLDPINPGGPLDFYNVAANPQDLEILKVKEIKNGRLAMIAMLGVFIQGLATDEGPAANWGKHVADPFGYNFVTLNAVYRTPVL